MIEQKTTYQKLDDLLILSNEIRNDILARKVIPVDVVDEMENHFLDVLSTNIHDEYNINYFKQELKKYDDMFN